MKYVINEVRLLPTAMRSSEVKINNLIVRLADVMGEYECKPGQPVLDALFPVHNKEILVGCRSGGCGLCKVRVLEGSYHCGTMSKAHVSDVESAAGFALACKMYPDSDVLIKPCKKRPKMWVDYGKPDK